MNKKSQYDFGWSMCRDFISGLTEYKTEILNTGFVYSVHIFWSLIIIPSLQRSITCNYK
jgi:hypothetical protein